MSAPDLYFMVSEDGLSFEEFFPPEPGETCLCCQRRVNKPRQKTSPGTKRIAAGALPVERAENVETGLDGLQAYTGADSKSYPRGSLMEALLLLGGQHRELLRFYFEGLEEEEAA